MTIPRQLTLRNTPDGLRLIQQPVRELTRLREKRHRLRHATLAEANTWLSKIQPTSPLLELTVELDAAPATQDLALRLSTGANESTLIRWQQNGELALDRTQSGRADFHRRFAASHAAPVRPANAHRLRAYLDTSSIELLGGDGEASLTALILPAAGTPRLQLEGGTPTTRVRNLEIWELRPAVK